MATSAASRSSRLRFTRIRAASRASRALSELPRVASHSRRDAPGCCRSGPCDTMGRNRHGRRANLWTPHRAGGSVQHSERMQREGGAAVRKEHHALFGAQYTRPTTVEVTETAMTRIRSCPLARSSECTAGTLAVASSDLPVRQEDKPDAIALDVSLRQPDAPMVGARARIAPNVSSLKSCSSGPRPTPPAEPSPRRALPRGARRARR